MGRGRKARGHRKASAESCQVPADMYRPVSELRLLSQLQRAFAFSLSLTQRLADGSPTVGSSDL
jgi:hypothetical protein